MAEGGSPGPCRVGGGRVAEGLALALWGLRVAQP